MSFLKNIIEKYNSWKEQRFFKKHGVNNWEHYNLKYDKDFKNTAYKIKEMFHGYNTVIIIPYPVMVSDFFGTTIYTSDVNNWCKQNCIGKYRIQLLSLCKDVTTGELFYGSPQGLEEMLIAFKEKDDAASFIMLYDGRELHSKQNIEVITIQ